MPSTSGRTRLASEFAVIVIGVLVALGVDAAWETRQDNARLEAYLLRLESDLLESEAALDSAIAQDSIVARSAASFARGINANPIAPADSLDEWFTRTYGPSSFHPRIATLQALVESGDLRLVDDTELHDAILKLVTAIDVWRNTYPRMQQAQFEAFGRSGYFLNLRTEVGPSRSGVPDWADLSHERGLTSEVRQMGVSAITRYSVMQELRERQRELLQSLQTRR